MHNEEAKEVSSSPQLSNSSTSKISYIDLSLMYETSSNFLSSKYPDKKTSVRIEFVKHISQNRMGLFLITIVRKVGVYYSAYDASSYFLLKTKENLISNKRYLVYGKIKFDKILFLNSEFIEKVDFRKLLYQLL